MVFSDYFPFYKNPHIPSSKELHADYLREQVNAFKLNDEVELDVDMLSGFIERRITERYHKTQHLLSGANRVDVITKDGEFDAFTWHTTGDKLKNAVRFGIVATYSVTGKVIAALGKYRSIQLQRIKEGFVSHRFSAKQALLDLYQDRFEALEQIESLVNAGVSPEEYKNKFNQYIEALQSIKQSLQQRFQDMDISGSDFTASLDEDIRQAEAMRDLGAEMTTRASTGLYSVFTFVKEKMIRNLREMQFHNQAMTYNMEFGFALTRGDLNSCIEDAELIIEEYEAPPNDRIDPVHHGDYGQSDTQVVYDSAFHCHSAEEEQRALLAISLLEGIYKLTEQEDQPDALYVSNRTKWRNDGFVYSVKKTGAWFANVLIKLVVGAVEFPLTLFIEPLTFGLAKPFFQGLRRLAVAEVTVKHPVQILQNKTYDKLTAETYRPHESLGLRMRHFVANAFRNSIRNFIYAAEDIGRNLTVHLFDTVIADYRDGEVDKSDLRFVLGSVEDEIALIESDKDRALASILKRINPDKDYVEHQAVGKKFATPDYVPYAGDADDPLNAFANGIQWFSDLFMHHIHAKHPFAGLIFTLTYITGGLAILAPKSVAFLGKGYAAYSQGMGYGMSNDPIYAAISSGCTQAQLTSALYEFGIHGPSSWAVTSATDFEKDPFTSTIYAGTALLLGHLIVYKFNIPWLSESLRADMGTVPATSLGFVGAKLGIGVFELLKEEDEVHLAQSEYAKILEQLTVLVSSMSQKDLARVQLPGFLATNANHLPHLSAESKHSVYQLLRENFSFQEMRALSQMLYPKKHTSIVRTLAGMVAGYPAGLARILFACVSSIVQGNIQPLKSASTDVGLKVLNDVNLLARGVSRFAKVAISFVRRHLKTVGDVIFNSIAARAETTMTGTSHIAKHNYEASAKLDCTYEKLRQVFSMPMDAALKEVTPAQPAAMLPVVARTLASNQAALFSGAASTTSMGSSVITPHINYSL